MQEYLMSFICFKPNEPQRMWETLLYPLLGIYGTAICIATFYFCKISRKPGLLEQRHQNEVDNQQRIYTQDDLNAAKEKYKNLSKQMKDLGEEVRRLPEFFNPMRKVAQFVDPYAKYHEDENVRFENTSRIITTICEEKKQAETSAMREKKYKERLRLCQMKILQLLPPAMFYSRSRFLHPSPVHRVGLFVDYIKGLRGMCKKRIQNQQRTFTKKRCLRLVQSCPCLHNSKQEKNHLFRCPSSPC